MINLLGDALARVVVFGQLVHLSPGIVRCEHCMAVGEDAVSTKLAVAISRIRRVFCPRITGAFFKFIHNSECAGWPGPNFKRLGIWPRIVRLRIKLLLRGGGVGGALTISGGEPVQN